MLTISCNFVEKFQDCQSQVSLVHRKNIHAQLTQLLIKFSCPLYSVFQATC
jgi:hypothetical protein